MKKPKIRPRFHAHDPLTSKVAAKDANGVVKAHLDLVWAALRRHPKDGLCAFECSKLIGLDLLQTMKRISDLHNQGLVKESGLHKRNPSGRWAVIWKVVLFNREF